MTALPRVGVIGFMHEVNALAERVTLEEGWEASAAPGGLVAAWEAGPAIERLRALRPVEIVELPVWEFGASGPLRDDAFAASYVHYAVDGRVTALRGDVACP